MRKIQVDKEADRDYHFASVEKIFVPMMVFTACAMAFAHGSNDVANGIGPLAAVVSIIQSGGDVAQKAALPLWILVMGGVGIVLGLATLGYKVMQTIGTRITQLTPSRGFCATLAAASTVVLASRIGLPVSTTHIAVGAVIGVGLARGVGAIDLRVIGGIVVSWLVTLPVGGADTVLLTGPEQDQRILVAIDFSEDSKAALLWACNFAACSSAPLILLHVVHDLASHPGFYHPEKSDHLEPMQEVAESMMTDFLAQLKIEHPELCSIDEADLRFIPGLPPTRIIEVAGLLNSRLIVIGGRGINDPLDKRLGSVAQRVVELSSWCAEEEGKKAQGEKAKERPEKAEKPVGDFP